LAEKPAGLPRRPNETEETLNQAANTSKKNRADPEEQCGKAFNRENAGEKKGQTGTGSKKGYCLVVLGCCVKDSETWRRRVSHADARREGVAG